MLDRNVGSEAANYGVLVGCLGLVSATMVLMCASFARKKKSGKKQKKRNLRDFEIIRVDSHAVLLPNESTITKAQQDVDSDSTFDDYDQELLDRHYDQIDADRHVVVHNVSIRSIEDIQSKPLPPIPIEDHDISHIPKLHEITDTLMAELRQKIDQRKHSKRSTRQPDLLESVGNEVPRKPPPPLPPPQSSKPPPALPPRVPKRPPMPLPRLSLKAKPGQRYRRPVTRRNTIGITEHLSSHDLALERQSLPPKPENRRRTVTLNNADELYLVPDCEVTEDEWDEDEIVFETRPDLIPTNYVNQNVTSGGATEMIVEDQGEYEVVGSVPEQAAYTIVTEDVIDSFNESFDDSFASSPVFESMQRTPSGRMEEAFIVQI